MAYTESHIVVVGTLAADGEVRELDGGKIVCSGRVAVNMKLGKKEWTNWFSFSLWDKLAEAVGPLLRKGDKVFLRGPLELREYEGKSGKGVDATIYPDTIICLGSGRVGRDRDQGADDQYDGDLGPDEDSGRSLGREPSPFRRGNR